MPPKASPAAPKPRAHEPVAEVKQRLEQLGLVIRARRLQRGIRQQELAELLGISTVTVQKVEAGTPGVAWGIVASVVHSLDLPLDQAALSAEELDELLSLAAERERVR